jgi:hypothetical protein
MLPVNQIGTDGMTPVHGAMDHAVRVKLVEKMIFACIIHQSVRVIHPHDRRGKMELWSIGFLICSDGIAAARELRLVRHEKSLSWKQFNLLIVMNIGFSTKLLSTVALILI